MKIQFLLDENLSPILKTAVRRYEPTIRILRVGDSAAPALGTLDPDILHYLQANRMMLITDNRSSMPVHIQHHRNDGGHHWGVCWIRPGFGLGELVDTLYLIWMAAEAEDWKDRTDWIPY